MGANSITELALKAITDEDQIERLYSTPEAVLSYLRDNQNFKSLALQLRETMIKAGLCTDQSSTNDFVNILFERLTEQDVSVHRAKARNKNTIKKWFNGKTTSIRFRNDAIEVCFALSLSLDLTNEFLTKCGHHRLNVRNAYDAIYMYCLLNNRPFEVVTKLIKDYDVAIASDASSTSKSSGAEFIHNGDTTLILEQTLLENSDWNNDDEFFITFLKPNKERFLGYSATAVKEYYLLKNKLFISVFLRIVSSEEHEIDSVNEQQDKVYEVYAPVSFAVRSALEKCSAETHPLHTAYSILNKRINYSKEALREILHISLSNDDVQLQKIIAEVLQDIMSTEGVLKAAIKSIKDLDTQRIRERSESELSDSVMKYFPIDDTFVDFENDPTVIMRGMATRKAIVLMYFIIYSYELSMYISDFNYTSAVFEDEELGFDEFFEQLNQILDNCQLNRLYPANQFDWLILRSINELIINITSQDDIEYSDDSPLKFFNDVILLSFGDDPDEFYLENESINENQFLNRKHE